MTGFRLADEEGIGYRRKMVDGKLRRFSLPYRDPLKINSCYTLDELKWIKVKTIIENLGKITEFEGDSILRFGLNRFNRSYDTTDIEDFLIDLITCFDGLYSLTPDEEFLISNKKNISRNIGKNNGKNIDKNTDKGTLVMKRVKYFLETINGKKFKPPKKLTQDILYAYVVRNSIIHQGKWFNEGTKNAYLPEIKHPPSYTILNLKKYLRYLRDYVRESLCCYIKTIIEPTQIKTSSDLRKKIIEGMLNPIKVKRYNRRDADSSPLTEKGE